MQLVVVESPTKAKKIGQYLGDQYTVRASMGHVRDLPKSKLGVDTEDDFQPTYVTPTKARKTITELKKLAKEADSIVLATDPDREGEAIAWHLLEAFKDKTLKEKSSRAVFHSPTLQRKTNNLLSKNIQQKHQHKEIIKISIEKSANDSPTTNRQWRGQLAPRPDCPLYKGRDHLTQPEW